MPVQEILVHVACAKQDDEHFRRLAHAYDDFDVNKRIDLSIETAVQHDQALLIVADDVPAETPLHTLPANEPLSGMPRTSSTTLDNPVMTIPQTTLGKRPPVYRHSVGTASKKLKRLVPPNVPVPSPDYIEDTPLTRAALESQLFTSSLAMQQELEQDAQKLMQTSSPSPTRPQPPLVDCPTPKSSPPVAPRSISSNPEPDPNQASRPAMAAAAESAPLEDAFPASSSAALPDNQSPISSQPLPTPPPRRSTALPSSPSQAPALPSIERSSPVTLPPWLISSAPPPSSEPSHSSLVVFAPSPIVNSAGAYGAYSHVTPLLAHLHKILPPATHWHPLANIRRMPAKAKPGLWRFCVDGWDKASVQETWDYLKDFVLGDGKVGSGKAGWGTSVWMEKATTEDVALNQGIEEGGEREEVEVGKSTIMRFRCDGEVAVHVWLLLYTASKSKVKRAGAQWVTLEAGKEVVDVQMSW